MMNVRSAVNAVATIAKVTVAVAAIQRSLSCIEKTGKG
jgi:hypothetical protein